jgi:hypothetical protein
MFVLSGRNKKTPDDKMFCECGFPILPQIVRISIFPYKRVITERKDKCIVCGSINVIYR